MCDEEFETILDEPRFVDNGNVTKDIFANPEAKVLEINSKTGLYPLYAAYSIYISRVGDKELDFDEKLAIWNKVVFENIYVICKTPMAKAITRRTLLGYRKGKINAHAFDDLVNQMKEKRTQIVQKIKSPKFWNKGGKEMKFDAIVGNPPYQGVNHQQIYPFFYLASISLAETVSLIFPIGWQKPKNANNLKIMNNEAVKEDKQIVSINNVQNVFPSVSGAEWVNIVLWKKGYDNGYEGKQLIYTNGKNPSIVKLGFEENELAKPSEIVEFGNLITNSNGFTSLQTIMSVSKPYGLRKDVFSRCEYYNLKEMQAERIRDDDIKVYGSKGLVRYVPFDYELPKKTVAFNKYKIFVGSAWGNMSGSAGLGGAYADIIIGFPHEICTETFQESGCFDDFETAKKHAKYIMTKFARALLFVNKVSQMSTQAWGAVPVQDYHEPWWNEPISVIDEHLFKKYGVPSNIKDFVKKNIQEKTTRNIVNFDR